MGTVSFEDEARTHARQQLVDPAETCGVKEVNEFGGGIDTQFIRSR
jgi:hypothetical protein